MAEKSTPLAPEQASGKGELDYQLFIITFTIFSLIIAAALFFLPLAPAAEQALLFLNLLISVVFMVDFFYLLLHARNKWIYMKTQGWLDFLGSLPFSPLFRLFRVVRLVGGWRELSRRGAHPVWNEIVRRRAENALRYTVFVAILVITHCSNRDDCPPDGVLSVNDIRIWRLAFELQDHQATQGNH
jgi:hypothetical protein